MTYRKKICNCSYTTITDIERYVLEKARTEINDKSDIRFSYKRKQIKNKGRLKTIGWTFTIKEKSAKEKQKIAQSWGLEDAAFVIQKTNSLTAAQEEKPADYNPFTDPNVEPVF